MKFISDDFSYKLFIAAIIISVLQILSLKYVSHNAPQTFLLAFAVLFIFMHFDPRIEISLIAISLFEFLILNDSYNLILEYIVFQNIFLYLTIFLFYIGYINGKIKVEPLYIAAPIIAFSLYIIFLFVLGLSKGFDPYYLIFDLYQNLYLLLCIPIYYSIKSLGEYRKIFFILILVFVIIALIYIYENYYGKIRFTTFHNGFLPLIIGIFYSFILFYWGKNKLIAAIAFIGAVIITIASIMSLTRTLWITNLVSVASITYIYIKYYTSSRIRLKKAIFYLTILVLPLIFYADHDDSPEPISTNAEQRLQSLSNVSDDVSFLMRIEISYYAFEKFLNSPFYGEGFGNRLRFKIFENTQPLFIDNSYFYYLWKGGIIALILVIWIYVRFYKQLFSLIRANLPINRRALIIGLLGGFNAILVYGIFSAALMGYRLNFLYALCFAYVEYESKLLNNE